MFKLLNGDLYQLSEQVLIKDAKEELTKQLGLPGYQHLEILTEDEKIDPEKVYPVYIRERFFPEWVEEDKLYFYHVSVQEKAIPYLKAHPWRINWAGLNLNPHPEAIQWLREKPEEILWGLLCSNTNPEAVKMVEEKLEREGVEWADWGRISQNPSAIGLIKTYPEYVVWEEVCLNPSVEVIPILIDRWDKRLMTLTGYISSFTKPEVIPYLIERPALRPLASLVVNPDPMAFEWIKTLIKKTDKWWIQPLHYNRNPDVVKWVLDTYPDEYSLHTKSILVANPNVELGEEFINKHIFANRNPKMYPLAREYLRKMPKAQYTMKVEFAEMAFNPVLFTLLEEFPEWIDYCHLSQNTGLFDA